MTKEEILAMKAGEYLDGVVAEQVMDEIQPKSAPQNALEQMLADNPIRSEKGNWICLCDYEHGDIPEWHPLHFSTDISAAWQVVEKMREIKDSKGNQLLCCLKIYCDVPGEVWDIHWSYAELSVMNDGHKDHKLPLSWYSFPEAICKAALLAKYSIKNE